MTRFALNVERTAPKPLQPENLSLADQILAELKDRLPADACCFAMGHEAPTILLCHRGRALGLAHQDAAGSRPCSIVASTGLRCSGMRIEVARSFNEAMKLIAEMGVVLKPAVKSIFAAQDFFREETRRPK